MFLLLNNIPFSGKHFNVCFFLNNNVDDWWSSVTANIQSNVPTKQAIPHKHTVLHFSCSRSHPWVRGSSHCVVRVLWLTKYTLPLSWRFSADTKKTLKKHVSINRQGSEGSPEPLFLKKTTTKQKCHNHERKPASLCGISLLLELIPRWGQIFACV